MILGFSTKFPKGKGTLSGKTTYFHEKIITALWQDNQIEGGIAVDLFAPRPFEKKGMNT